MLKALFTQSAASEMQRLEKSSPKTYGRIWALIASVSQNPREGIGKPEALRFELSGKWSRRIDSKNRLIYSFDARTLIVISVRGHYSDR